MESVPLKLSLIYFIKHYVESDTDIQDICEVEIDRKDPAFISDSIVYPCWVVSFTDDENHEFHLVELSKLDTYVQAHIRNKVYK